METETINTDQSEEPQNGSVEDRKSDTDPLERAAQDWLDRVRLYAAERTPVGISSGSSEAKCILQPDWFDYVTFTYGQRLVRKNMVPILSGQLMGLSLVLKSKSIQELLCAEVKKEKSEAKTDQDSNTENQGDEETKMADTVKQLLPEKLESAVADLTAGQQDPEKSFNEAEMGREELEAKLAKLARKRSKKLAKQAAKKALQLLGRVSTEWYNSALYARRSDDQPDETTPDQEQPQTDLQRTIAAVRSQMVQICQTDPASSDQPDEPHPKLSQMDLVLVQFALCALWLLESKKTTLKNLSAAQLSALCHVVQVLGHAHGIEDEFNLCGGLGPGSCRTTAMIDTIRSRCAVIMRQHYLPMLSVDNMTECQKDSNQNEVQQTSESVPKDQHKGTKKELLRRPEWTQPRELLRCASKVLPELNPNSMINFWLAAFGESLDLTPPSKVTDRLKDLLLGVVLSRPKLVGGTKRLQRRTSRAIDHWTKSKTSKKAKKSKTSKRKVFKKINESKLDLNANVKVLTDPAP